MTHPGRYHGGLVFFGNQDQALDRFTRIVTATLEDYGHPVERQSILDHNQSRIVSSHYLVKLTLSDAPGDDQYPSKNGKSMQRLEIAMHPIADDQDDKDISELMLVVMLYRMVDIHLTRAIEWLNPNTVLTVAQFMGAFANVSPRRVRGRQEILETNDAPFAPVAETEQGLSMQYDAIYGQHAHIGKFGLIDISEEERLSFAYRQGQHPDQIDSEESPSDMAQSDIRRLATWGLTGMVAVLSTPVALSMVAVNLARGEDFRLNTNVLSLTGLLVMLQSTGAMADAMSYLPL